MSRFKVGDWVWRLDDASGKFTLGKQYIVSGLGGYVINIACDDAGIANGWSSDKFELCATGAQNGDGPSRTVTRREIVPGVYGRVKVVREEFGTANIGIVDRNNEYHTTNFTAEELREAAHTLNQIAEVLEDG